MLKFLRKAYKEVSEYMDAKTNTKNEYITTICVNAASILHDKSVLKAAGCIAIGVGVGLLMAGCVTTAV